MVMFMIREVKTKTWGEWVKLNEHRRFRVLSVRALVKLDECRFAWAIDDDLASAALSLISVARRCPTTTTTKKKGLKKTFNGPTGLGLTVCQVLYYYDVFQSDPRSRPSSFSMHPHPSMYVHSTIGAARARSRSKAAKERRGMKWS